MDWKTLLAYITGSVDKELLLRNEFLITENRILRDRIPGRVRLHDGERRALAALGKQLGQRGLAEVATIVRPETILAWHRKLVGKKFDGSRKRRSSGRPQTAPALEALVVRLAQENGSWGYDRIVGAVANLGYAISDQTVGNILRRHGIPRVPERRKATTWRAFIRAHLDVLVATDFRVLHKSLPVFGAGKVPRGALPRRLELRPSLDGLAVDEVRRGVDSGKESDHE